MRSSENAPLDHENEYGAEDGSKVKSNAPSEHELHEANVVSMDSIETAEPLFCTAIGMDKEQPFTSVIVTVYDPAKT